MTKQLRDLEAELDEERKQKTAAMTIKKVKQNLISRKKKFLYYIISQFFFHQKEIGR